MLTTKPPKPLGSYLGPVVFLRGVVRQVSANNLATVVLPSSDLTRRRRRGNLQCHCGKLCCRISSMYISIEKYFLWSS
jgi:hypothetical protein